MVSCLVMQLLILTAVMFIATTVQAQVDLSGFSVLPSNVTARLTFPARFDCQATTDTGFFIRWAVGVNEMLGDSNCAGCQILGNGSLYFPSVTQAHGGLYTCFLVGGATQPRIGVYLTVAEAPRIITPASDIRVNQGETLEINVYVTGVPRPSITWRTEDGEVLNSNPRFTMTGSNLSLPNARYTDAGEYTITAQNIADTAETRYTVIVQFSPVIIIIRNPDSDMVEENAMVTVTCSITSNPESTISWEQVTANDRTNKTDRATTQVLQNNQFNTVSLSTISFTNDDINGFSKFCCSAINSIGTAKSCLNFTETAIDHSIVSATQSQCTTVTFPTTTATVTSTVSATQSQCTTVTFPTTTTATVTRTVSATESQCTTVIISPSTAQCSNQQITIKSDSSCNAIAICIPVAMVIAVVVCVIVFVAVWRLRHKAIYNFVTTNPQMARIYNDLYGAQNPSLKCVYDYPAFLPERYDDHSVASNVAEKAVSTNSTDSAEKSTGKSMTMKNPLYVPTSKTQTVNEETD